MDRNSTDPLFYDIAQESPYTVAQVLTELGNLYKASLLKVTEISARVQALQTRLATTNQNDMRASLQAVKDSLGKALTMLSAVNLTNTQLVEDVGKMQSVSQPIDSLGASLERAITVYYPKPVPYGHAVNVQIEGDGTLQVVILTKAVKRPLFIESKIARWGAK